MAITGRAHQRFTLVQRMAGNLGWTDPVAASGS